MLKMKNYWSVDTQHVEHATFADLWLSDENSSKSCVLPVKLIRICFSFILAVKFTPGPRKQKFEHQHNNKGRGNTKKIFLLKLLLSVVA